MTARGELAAVGVEQRVLLGWPDLWQGQNFFEDVQLGFERFLAPDVPRYFFWPLDGEPPVGAVGVVVPERLTDELALGRTLLVAESGRASGRAELRALIGHTGPALRCRPHADRSVFFLAAPAFWKI